MRVTFRGSKHRDEVKLPSFGAMVVTVVMRRRMERGVYSTHAITQYQEAQHALRKNGVERSIHRRTGEHKANYPPK